ncbi:MAG: hypothetical protein FJX68_03660 [Alphaproteobacteria bacterium]|nr:hypothetical protein [Alphaproteobacteria bacterium]
MIGRLWRCALLLPVLLGLSAPTLAQQSLSIAEVQRIIARAVNEAQARGRPATIAVVDRVGNVLGVFAMNGAAATAAVTSGRSVTTGLEGANVPASAAAIAKAVTGAYLSSNGNAFTSRTANQIVQEFFNPLETNQPGGPLFGVQFSQLPCSDLNVRFVAASVNQNIGPKRSPLGLSADPGGMPLYKANILVGGIGVIADAIYGLDRNITDFDTDSDELIAIAGSVGFAAPVGIRANRIAVDGKTLRFADRDIESLVSAPAAAPAFAAINGVLGTVQAVTGYTNGAVIVDGQAFGTAASGYRLDNSGLFADLNGFVLVDGTNTQRFAPRDATDGGLTRAEVTGILRAGLQVANAGRAQIRRPLNDQIHVTLSVVDTAGTVLGVVRTPDGPVFGTDVSLQKARSAAFFSNVAAAADLTAGGFASYVASTRALLGPNALADGFAYAARSIGNLARPFFPDGNSNNQPGPLSRPFPSWSPFSTGLQLDLIANNVVQHLNFVTGASGVDTAVGCTGLPLQVATGMPRLANGLQIFAGGVPVYKNGVLAGAIGISGDGIDQDDMIAFLGTHNAGLQLASGVANAPMALRADNLAPQGIRLRYVSCPFRPFVNDDTQTPCSGK